MNELDLAKNFPPQTEENWKEIVEKALKGVPFDKALKSKTYDDIEILPLYSKDAEQEKNAADLLNGLAARSIVAQSAKSEWDIRQIHCDPDPGNTNKAIMEDLEGGATSIELRILSPGQSGIEINSTETLSRILDNVQLELAPVSLKAQSDYFPKAELLLDLWDKKTISPDKALGAFNADPLGVLARHGSLPETIGQAHEKIAKLSKLCIDSFPNVKAILADGTPFHEAGASEAQEIACTAASFVAYLRALDTQGLPLERAVRTLSVSLAADADLFLNIAKFRTMKRILFRIAEACGIASQSSSIHITAQCSERMLSRRDPYVNILRGTVACAGAALGGAGSIAVLPFTWPIGRPDKSARRIARNTHIVLQEESSLSAVIDPAGGSWFVEQLTEALSQKAWTLFQEIEAEGGLFQSLQSGKIKALISDTVAKRQKNIALGRDELTGVSAFPNLFETDINAEPHGSPPEIEDEAITADPLMPIRLSAPFETLRDASDNFLASKKHRPKIFLANLGTISEFNARANYATNFFAAGGIEAVGNDGFSKPEDVVAAFIDSGAAIVCLCSSDEKYSQLAFDLAQKLKDHQAKHIYLAGRAGEARDKLKKAGIGTFIHMGCNMLDVLSETHEILGIPR